MRARRKQSQARTRSNTSTRYTVEFQRDAVVLARSPPHRNVTEFAFSSIDSRIVTDSAEG